MKSDVELAIQWSKRFEKLLSTKFNAIGKGLHERIDSVKAHLPDDIQSKLRFVATIRNKLVHDDKYTAIEDRAGFERVCADVSAYLEDARDATSPDADDACLARLLHHFHVEYLKKNVPYVLRSGQIIPVWDLSKWTRIDEFEFHCSSAVRWNEVLISGPGFDHPQEEVVTRAALVSTRSGRLDAHTRALVSHLASVPLGNVGGRRILRPDPILVGMVPMEARFSFGKPTIETHAMSMLEWAQEVEGMHITDHPMPELQFYVETRDGEREGFDVRSRKAKTVTSIELPFSICSGEELDILSGDGDGLENEMEMLFSITQGVRRLVEANRFRGKVYFGYDLPAEGEGLPDVDTEAMTLAHYTANRADLDLVYEIPFLGDNPFDVLTVHPRSQIKALLRQTPPIRRTHRSKLGRPARR